MKAILLMVGLIAWFYLGIRYQKWRHNQDVKNQNCPCKEHTPKKLCFACQKNYAVKYSVCNSCYRASIEHVES